MRATNAALHEVFTLEEVADLLQVTKRSIYKFKSRGWLRISYLGGSRKEPRVFRQDLDEFLAKSRGLSSPRIVRSHHPKNAE